jgi:hypothetical protein
LHTSSRQRMVMDFCPWRGGLYVFSSIYKKILKLFIHQHEGYWVGFKPLKRRLCLVSSDLLLVTQSITCTLDH